MAGFHFTKLIMGVGPTLAKETILSKIVSSVDVFRISLSEGFDDQNRKYIDTVLKLDYSKSILLETRGLDSRTKNLFKVELKKGQEIVADYSEYAQEGTHKIYIDYPYLGELSKGDVIRFEQSDIEIQVKSTNDDYVNCKVIKGGTLLQHDRILFRGNVIELPFLLDKDKKDILWGLEQGIHIIGASGIKSQQDLKLLRSFLKENNAEHLKIFGKIETKEAVENLEGIIEESDGIIFVIDKISSFTNRNKINNMIAMCKNEAKSVIITYAFGVNTDKYPLFDEKIIKNYCDMAVDSFMIEPIIVEDNAIDLVGKLYSLIKDCKPNNRLLDLKDFYKNEDFIIRDYIIYNAYKISQELDIKAIVCYTENGYTTSRLSSLTPQIPIIAFTKSDGTFRFLNTVQGIKGYKISQSFNYENLKRIGKEMIRIIFKGNISLDDKILILQSNEIHKDEKTDMINGVELYKFKNI